MERHLASELIQRTLSADELPSTYSKLLDFREELREIDTNLQYAALARDELIALSVNSAMAALEREESAQVSEDDEKGLVGLFQTSRSTLSISSQDFDSLISKWNTSARNHGVAPFSHPTSYCALHNELRCNAGAHLLLPNAKKEARGKGSACLFG